MEVYRHPLPFWMPRYLPLASSGRQQPRAPARLLLPLSLRPSFLGLSLSPGRGSIYWGLEGSTSPSGSSVFHVEKWEVTMPRIIVCAQNKKRNDLCTNDCPCSSKLNLYKELHMERKVQRFQPRGEITRSGDAETHSMSAKKYGSWNEETTSRQPMIHSVYFLTDVASVTNQPLLLLQFLIYTVATSSMEFYCRDDVVTPGS